MIDKYQFFERVAICKESRLPASVAQEIAARQFFTSCNLPTEADKADAERIGWSKLKMFRVMNQGGLREWRSGRDWE